MSQIPELPFSKERTTAGKRETLVAVSQATEGKVEAHTNISPFSVTNETGCILDGHVNGIPTKILIDTGAAATVLAKEIWEKASPNGSKLLNTVEKKLVGTPLQHHGTTTVQLTFRTKSTKVIVADQIATDLILGRDFNV